MLFGYDTGIISAVLVYIHEGLNTRTLASNEKELITLLCSGGAFFGAIMAGLTADKHGRKAAIYFGCVLFIVGAVLQGAAYTTVQMAVSRVIVGFGVGSAAMVVPLYIAEVAPAKARGRLIGLNNMSITGGQVISYAIGAAFANANHGWRFMVGLGALPAIILAALMPFCPESPRHLVYNNRKEKTEAVLRRIYGHPSDNQLASILASISAACDEAREINEGATRWTKIKQLHTVPSNLRALISACGLMVISQLSGFNTLMYYSSTLFALVGFDNPTGGWNRRRRNEPHYDLGQHDDSVAFQFIPVDIDTLELKGNGVSPPAIVVLVFIIWFVVFYGVSVGNTEWMNTDFFPLEVRAMGTMWLTCSNCGSNVIVSSTFLSMMKAMIPSEAFRFYAAICEIGYI
ncbi:myo-inositol transporter [Aspergillus alliaceus]|uniref:Myo-inositol transporter n=1 Tax=Petromyces alliaceus TaxID=209559 RepID=A0A8H6E1X3_PETAA|nr:myo-inositol transporter [Aspergillus burnettii]